MDATPRIGAEPKAASRPGSRTAFLLSALLAAHALLAWQVRPRAVFTFGDDSAYILLSRSLRALSYREIQFVGSPIAARYPPGYPAVLALCSALFGEHLDVFSVVGILFSVSGIWALYDVVRRRWSTNVALVVVALVAINPSLLEVMSMPVTETMFTSLVVWTLWCADRMDDSGVAGVRDATRRTRQAVITTALSIMAAMTRSAGITLPLSLVAHWAWRRRWRAAAIVTVAATVFVGGWLAWTSVAPSRDVRLSYIDDVVRPTNTAPTSLVTVIAKRLADNVPTYVTQVSLTMLPAPVTPRTKLDNIGWVLLLGSLFLVGFVSAWRRWQVAAIYMVAYCGLLAAWPYLQDRFLVPVIPLGLTFLVVGAAALGDRMKVRSQVPLVLLGAMLAGFALPADAALVQKLSDCDRTRVACATPIALDFIDAARVAERDTPPTARFIAPKGAALYYHGARQTVFWEEAIRQDSTNFLRYLRERGVTHILLTPVYGDYDTMLRLVARECPRFSVVRALSPHTLLLAFRDSAVTVPEGERACSAVRRALATANVVAAAGHADDDGLLGTRPRRVLADQY